SLPRVRALVLAAGAGSRFGGGKLSVRIDGQPVLQHVLDAVAEAGLDDPIVVVSPGSEIRGLDWRRARQVTNPDPARGLSSSLRLRWGHWTGETAQTRAAL